MAAFLDPILMKIDLLRFGHRSVSVGCFLYGIHCQQLKNGNVEKFC